MAVWVQDGDFGIIIGEPSSNAPSAFGDMLNFTLPRTRIDVRVSYSRFVRPDVDADQATLVPDIAVPSDQALEAALAYFNDPARVVNPVVLPPLSASETAFINSIESLSGDIRRILGVDFDVIPVINSREFSNQYGVQRLTWAFLELHGTPQITGASRNDVGNAFGSFTGDVFVLNHNGQLVLRIDTGLANQSQWSPQHRAYQIFTLR
jgi:hypothetical protein